MNQINTDAINPFRRKGDNEMNERKSEIIISAELMMYGSVNVSFEFTGNNCLARYIAIADGGTVVSQGEKEYNCVEVSNLINTISREYSSVSEDDDGVIWKLICFNEGKVTINLDDNSWGRDKLLALIEIIQSFIKDDEPIKELKELASL